MTLYSILHSSTYRERYYEFLKTDFPRIPFTKDKNLFLELSQQGTELIKHHLLEINYSKKDLIFFKERNQAEREVKVISYDESSKQLNINANHYFEPVRKDVYEFEIGGYIVIDKYLKSRVGRILSVEEIDHVKKVYKSLENTIDIMFEIDKLFVKIDLDKIVSFKN